MVQDSANAFFVLSTLAPPEWGFSYNPDTDTLTTKWPRKDKPHKFIQAVGKSGTGKNRHFNEAAHLWLAQGAKQILFAVPGMTVQEKNTIYLVPKDDDGYGCLVHSDNLASAYAMAMCIVIYGMKGDGKEITL